MAQLTHLKVLRMWLSTLYRNTNTFVVGLEWVSELSDVYAARSRGQRVENKTKQRQEHQKKLIVSGSSLLGSSAVGEKGRLEESLLLKIK